MALTITCPSCSGLIDDDAPACPGCGRIFDAASLRGLLDDDDAPAGASLRKVLLQPHAVLQLAPGAHALSALEQHVASFLDGVRTVVDVVRASGLTQVDVDIALHELADKGALALAAPRAATAAAGPPLPRMLQDDVEVGGPRSPWDDASKRVVPAPIAFDD